MTTNITAAHREAPEALREALSRTLPSSPVNGQPGPAAIVAITPDGDDYAITPLFVSVADAMRLSDHDGHTPANRKGLLRYGTDRKCRSAGQACATPTIASGA